jgi:hypothetical protein
MMKAVLISETSVYFENTRRNVTEGCRLYTRHHKNLKFHLKHFSEIVWIT